MSDLNYIRDPAEIYRRSFAMIRAEADLSRLPNTLHPLAIRLVHAVGDVGVVDDLAWSEDAVEAGQTAVAAGAPILVDAEMVSHGIIRRLLAGNELICSLNHPDVPDAAQRTGTTRSAAAVDLWRDRVGGAVVAIGNAPTALFRLLELLAEGAPPPALIIGFPVGFVGAAESKQALIERAPCPFLALRGRRGGSALAAAAVNALAAPRDSAA